MTIYHYESLIGIIAGILFCFRGYVMFKRKTALDKKYGFILILLGICVSITFTIKWIMWSR